MGVHVRGATASVYRSCRVACRSVGNCLIGLGIDNGNRAAPHALLGHIEDGNSQRWPGDEGRYFRGQIDSRSVCRRAPAPRCSAGPAGARDAEGRNAVAARHHEPFGRRARLPSRPSPRCPRPKDYLVAIRWRGPKSLLGGRRLRGSARNELCVPQALGCGHSCGAAAITVGEAVAHGSGSALPIRRWLWSWLSSRPGCPPPFIFTGRARA